TCLYQVFLLYRLSVFFFFSSRRRHTRSTRDWSSDVCSSDLISSTIRNVMADLEEMGYLAQPHTSAGRVPTDAAYRFYVNSFPPSQASEAPPAAGSMPTRHSGIDGFMEGTSSHLSVVTRLTGLLLAPPLKT